MLRHHQLTDTILKNEKNSKVLWLTPLRDELLRHTAIVFLGMAGVHLCNLLFQMAVSRRLPQEEYALLAAFLGVLAIVQRPLATLTTAVSHHSSLLDREGRRGDVRRLLRKWLLLTGVPAAAVSTVILFFNAPLATLFHLDRVAPVVIAGAVLPALFWLPVLTGAGQGLQLFKWCSAANISGALARLALGAGFVWFLYPACGWAMLGHGLGLYIAAGVMLSGLVVMLFSTSKSHLLLPSLRGYLAQSFFIQIAYAVLMTADVVLVKHFIPEETEFAYAATLGRLVVFLPGAIVTAMFPKVASRGMGTREQHEVFLKALRWTVFMVAGSIAVCWLIPGLLARILFGMTDASLYVRRMIGWMALVMGLSALLNVPLQFLLAQRRFKALIPAVLGGFVYLISAWLFHDNAGQIVFAAGLLNAVALVFGLGCAWRRCTQHRTRIINETETGEDE